MLLAFGLAWLGLRDYDVGWAFKLSVMEKKKKKHKKNVNLLWKHSIIGEKNSNKKVIIKWENGVSERWRAKCEMLIIGRTLTLSHMDT